MQLTNYGLLYSFTIIKLLSNILYAAIAIYIT